MIHIIVILLLKILYDILPSISQEISWTLVNTTYMFATYLMFHYVRGIPFEFNAGAYDNLNLWEQIDNEDQYTPAKKFLLAVPICLFLVSTHYTRYDLGLFMVNFLATVAVVVPKLPAVRHRPLSSLPILIADLNCRSSTACASLCSTTALKLNAIRQDDAAKSSVQDSRGFMRVTALVRHQNGRDNSVGWQSKGEDVLIGGRVCFWEEQDRQIQPCTPWFERYHCCVCTFTVGKSYQVETCTGSARSTCCHYESFLDHNCQVYSREHVVVVFVSYRQASPSHQGTPRFCHIQDPAPRRNACTLFV